MDCGPPGSSAHGDAPGNNTGVHCHALLQGIFPIQGSDLPSPTSPELQVASLPAEPQGKLKQNMVWNYKDKNVVDTFLFQ